MVDNKYPETLAKPSAVYASYSAYLDEVCDPKSIRGYVYFIGPVGGPVKIGFTTYVEDRLRSLQTGSHLDLVLWASIEGTLRIEAEYHENLKNDRIRGEWFATSDSVILAIKSARTLTDQRRKWPDLSLLKPSGS